MKLSVVIPAYNESHRLGATLTELCDYLKEHYPDYEVLVVNDGSRDATAAIACSFAGRGVRLLDNARNRGKGAVVRQGMLAAAGERVLFMDADMATPIDQLPLFHKALDEGAPFAYGIRTYQKYETNGRLILGLGFLLLAHLVVLRRPVSDSQCGFKLFRREVAQAIFARMRINGGTFDLELFCVAQRLGHEGACVPVRWLNQPGSRINIVKCLVQDPCDMLRIRINDTLKRYGG